MAGKLRVYASQIDGVHEWIVAAPNQAAALAAWGVNQNLFEQGRAKLETEPAAVRVALKASGAPLWRLAGSNDPFAPVAAQGDVAGWRAAAKAVGAHSTKIEPKPSRAPLEKAQMALAQFEDESRIKRTSMEKRRRALERRAEEVENALNDERKRLAGAVDKLRRAVDV